MPKDLYLTTRCFFALAGAVGLFTLSFFSPSVFVLGQLGLFCVALTFFVDAWLLFRVREAVIAMRETGDRFSNGDDNEVLITIENRYPHAIRATILDELPAQFQIRDQQFAVALPAGASKTIAYHLRPARRGEYEFGALNLFVANALGLIQRRFRFACQQTVAVYPSYLQMRKYELLAVSDHLSEAGIKKVRRLGHTMEFDRIREYVQGDDYRTINWKATARRTHLMVNEFQDERAQHVYSVIDMGRVMKMPFAGMTLLDYAINTALVIANLAIRKKDKAGLITFSHRMGSLIAAERRNLQMLKILNTLYKQETDFLESSFELLGATIRRQLRQRSLVLLYTNFETLNSMQRQLPFLRNIARSHLLVVLFFENTELAQLLDSKPNTTEDIYRKTIAEKLAYEKRQIMKELSRHGIHSILTKPQNLNVSAINKYLELKARGLT